MSEVKAYKNCRMNLNTTISGKCEIYNSEVQYIRFNDEFVNPPVVSISIIGKPNSDGNIYISRIDEFGFEIRSNRDRLYDIASEINYIVNGNAYIAALMHPDNGNYNYFGKVDTVTGDILGMSVVDHDDFIPFTKDAYDKSSSNPKLIVNPCVIDGWNHIVTVNDLILTTPSLESVKLSVKNKLKNELNNYIEHGLLLDDKRIPFTAMDRLYLMEAICVNKRGLTKDSLSDQIFTDIVFTNGVRLNLNPEMANIYYTQLIRSRDYLYSKYDELCIRIDNMDDIDKIKEISLDAVVYTTNTENVSLISNMEESTNE